MVDTTAQNAKATASAAANDAQNAIDRAGDDAGNFLERSKDTAVNAAEKTYDTMVNAAHATAEAVSSAARTVAESVDPTGSVPAATYDEPLASRSAEEAVSDSAVAAFSFVDEAPAVEPRDPARDLADAEAAQAGEDASRQNVGGEVYDSVASTVTAAASAVSNAAHSAVDYVTGNSQEDDAEAYRRADDDEEEASRNRRRDGTDADGIAPAAAAMDEDDSDRYGTGRATNDEINAEKTVQDHATKRY